MQLWVPWLVRTMVFLRQRVQPVDLCVHHRRCAYWAGRIWMSPCARACDLWLSAFTIAVLAPGLVAQAGLAAALPLVDRLSQC